MSNNTNKKESNAVDSATTDAPTRAPVSRVEWDDSRMDTSYANVANAASTREEVTLLFGTNKTWNVSSDKPVKVELENRIILSPFAAKRFLALLGGVVDEYESRFGKLDIESRDKGSK